MPAARARKMLAALIVIAGLSAPLAAQAPPRLQWDQPTSLVADVRTWVYTLSLDGVALAAPLVQTCTAMPAPATIGAQCRAPIAVLTPGTHTLIVTATNTFSFATSDPLVGAQPEKPTNIRISFTITIP